MFGSVGISKIRFVNIKAALELRPGALPAPLWQRFSKMELKIIFEIHKYLPISISGLASQYMKSVVK